MLGERFQTTDVPEEKSDFGRRMETITPRIASRVAVRPKTTATIVSVDKDAAYLGFSFRLAIKYMTMQKTESLTHLL
jgi:hypothetical protein